MDRRLSDKGLTLLRVYIGGNAIISWYLAISDPRSLVGINALLSDGMPLVWFQAFIGICILMDLVINDFMPKRVTWKNALKYRHVLFSSLAFSFVGQVFSAAMSHQTAANIVYYVFNASIIMLASIVDAKKRSRDAECAMLYN